MKITTYKDDINPKLINGQIKHFKRLKMKPPTQGLTCNHTYCQICMDKGRQSEQKRIMEWINKWRGKQTYISHDEQSVLQQIEAELKSKIAQSPQESETSGKDTHQRNQRPADTRKGKGEKK